MRRVKLPLRMATVMLLGSVVALGSAAVASAADTPSPGPSSPADTPVIGESAAGKAVCTITDPTLDAISGMVATKTGFQVVEDGADNQTTLQVFTLDKKCKITKTDDINRDPYDPQDMALAADGSLWIADTGDVQAKPVRDRVALWRVPKGGGSAERYRVSYPDAKKNATALLLDQNDNPIIITQEGGKATLYSVPANMKAEQEEAQKMTKVGTVTISRTDTENPFAVVGNQITGAAKSPDGKKVVLRSYGDAYEFTVGDDGDIVKAITTTKPVITRLPNEPKGEAITFSSDGTLFYTLSKKPKDSEESLKVLQYTPYEPPPPVTAGPEKPAASDPDHNPLSWFDKLSPSQLTQIVAAVGVVGLVLAIAGIVGIRRARRRRREEEYDDDYDDDYVEPPARGRRGRAQVEPAGFGGLRTGQYDQGYEGFDPYSAQEAAGYAAGGYPSGAYQSSGYAAAGYPASGGYDTTGYADPAQQGAAYGAAQGYPADQYGGYAQPETYAAPDPYGQQPAGYGQQAAGYGQVNGYGAQPNGYGAQGAQSNGYGQQHYGADQQPGYAQPDAYGQPQYGAQPQYGTPEYGGPEYGSGYEDYDQDPRRR